MSEHYDHGPLRTYEITWKSGHIETVQGHQVTLPPNGPDLSGIFGGVATRRETEPRFMIHGEFDGRWRLVIAAPESELHSVRDVTDQEIVAPEATP